MFQASEAITSASRSAMEPCSITNVPFIYASPSRSSGSSSTAHCAPFEVKRTAMGGPVPPPRVHVLPLAAVSRSVPLSTNLSKMNGSKRSIRRLHCRFITRAREPSKRRRFHPDQLACASEVARTGCSERRSITTKFSPPGNPIPPARSGNRLTFAPLCAKGRNPPGARPPNCGACPAMRRDPRGGMPCQQLAAVCWLFSDFWPGGPARREPRIWSEANPVRRSLRPIVRPATAAPRALPTG